MPASLHRSPLAAIDPVVLYRILWLRIRVFVVEQAAAYPELDGRDLEPEAELMWIADGDDVLATLRILTDASAMRIGRVATAPEARGRGLAADLMRAAIHRCDELAPGVPIDLDAQMQLEEWYGRFGFVRSGAEFAEDGIPHIPMRRTSPVVE
ncbi:GNAT family N-acetyltransferase [Agromyces sp. LHK192]|uniref:GNAT family N-acetyltransferase n=1 Tax=Agromyces sp. LHK192 TaxID=2498704 RepID=UPI000FDC86D4|nr:GNAT family N-acetyltransferase [Agromyces sp. LHK192]